MNRYFTVMTFEGFDLRSELRALLQRRVTDLESKVVALTDADMKRAFSISLSRTKELLKSLDNSEIKTEED